jgi:NCS2 family nucleobase:cation symporter-2
MDHGLSGPSAGGASVPGTQGVVRRIKPANLTYDVDESPPPWLCLTVAVQHVIIIAVGMTFPVLLGRAIGLSHGQTESLVRVSMLAAGIGTLLQSIRRGPLGSGFLCPEGPDPSFLPACLLAGARGGLPLVFGMTALAGAFEGIMAPVMYRLRSVFPVEVTGVVVAMVGIAVVPSALANLLGVPAGGAGSGGSPLQVGHLLVGLAALCAMVGTNVWSRGSLRRYSILIGIGVGFACAGAAGLLGADQLREVARAPFAALPVMPGLSWSFSLDLVLPFAIAITCSMLKNIGDITTCQRINDAGWKRTDMVTVRGGILADGESTFKGGVMGGYGPASYSANVGLSVATGVTSKRVALYVGGICVLLSCCPKLAAAFAIMPAPVMGAQLLFCVSFMIVAGLQIIMSRMMDVRRTFVVGLSFAVGLGAGFLPGAFRDLPGWLQPVFTSILTAATVSAILLNLLLRLGVSRSARLDMPLGPEAATALWAFLEEQGKAWGARAEVVHRAAGAVSELMEQSMLAGAGQATVSARFDELNLDIDYEYDGPEVTLPDAPPQALHSLEAEPDFAAIAGYLVRRQADSVRCDMHDGRRRVRLHWDH